MPVDQTYRSAPDSCDLEAELGINSASMTKAENDHAKRNLQL